MTTELEAARQAGKLEGQIEAIENMLVMQNTKLEQHDKRIAIQEKITWAILGAITLIQSSDLIRAYLANVQ